jgi:hypothetical protein
VTTVHGISNATIVEGDDDVVALGSDTDAGDGDTRVIHTSECSQTDEFDRGSHAATFPRQGDEATGTVSGTTTAIFITSSRGDCGALRGITVIRTVCRCFARSTEPVATDLNFALFCSAVAAVIVVTAEVSTEVLSSTVTVGIADPCFGPAFAGSVAVFDFASCAIALVGVAELIRVLGTDCIPFGKAACIINFANGCAASFVVAAC